MSYRPLSLIPSRLTHSVEHPHWQTLRLRNSGHLKHHLVYPGDLCGLILSSAVEDDDPRAEQFNILPKALREPNFKSPLYVYSSLVKNERYPIDEILMVRYPYQVTGVMIYSRMGVHEQVAESVKKEITGPFVDLRKTHYEDHRWRVGMTITGLNNPTEQDRMLNFLQCINQIAPFDQDMLEKFQTMICNPDDQLSQYADQKIESYERDPKYFGYPPTRVYFGGNSFYHPVKDGVIATEISPLIQAILDANLDRVKALVTEKPTCVLECDPSGREATHIAADCGLLDIFKFLVSERKKLVPVYDVLQNNFDHSTRHSKHIFDPSKGPELLQVRREKVRELLSQPLPPQRTPLLQACIDGNFELVKVLVEAGASLEVMDTYGMKPLLLAVANDHFDIAKYLIAKGASLKHWDYQHKVRGTCYYRLLQHANTGRMARLLLTYHVDEELAVVCLGDALRAGNVDLSEALLYYVRHLDLRRWGLRALDLAISQKDPVVRVQMVLNITRYYDNFIPEGPYDSTLDQETRMILESHNQRYRQDCLIRAERPRMTSMTLNAQRTQLQTNLISNSETDVRVITTAVRDVSEDVQKAAFELFNKTFSLTQEEDTQDARKKYFDEYFKSKNIHAYVDLSFVRGELVGFLFYEFHRIDHSSVGPFTMFHAQLGCTVQNRLGLVANLGFRAGLTAYSPQNPVLMYGECIWPGYGFGFFPKHFNGFPCYAIPTDVLEAAVTKTTEQLNPDKSITTKIKVQKGSLSGMFKLHKFNFFNEKRSQQKALPVAFFLDQETRTQFCDHMKDNGITEQSLDEFKTLWSGLTMKTKL